MSAMNPLELVMKWITIPWLQGCAHASAANPSSETPSSSEPLAISSEVTNINKLPPEVIDRILEYVIGSWKSSTNPQTIFRSSNDLSVNLSSFETTCLDWYKKTICIVNRLLQQNLCPPIDQYQLCLNDETSLSNLRENLGKQNRNICISQGVDLPPNAMIVHRAQIEKRIQAAQDTALLVVWACLKSLLNAQPGIPTIQAPVKEIRDFFNNPTHAPLLGQVTELDLSNNGLKVVPDEIRKLEGLQELNLSENQLYGLSEFLGDLSQLKSLNLDGNPISQNPEKLPKFLADLPQLEDLGLPKLPEFLSHLLNRKKQNFALRQIWIRLRPLLNLQVGIRSPTTSAQEIRDFFNNPTHAPLLAQVKQLNLSELKLEVVPMEIQALKGLQELNLSSSIIDNQYDHYNHNKLKPLPEFLGSFSQLKKLSLSWNELEELPESFINLLQLENLDLSRNKLLRLSKSFGNLFKLKDLDLSQNDLIWLPESFCNLSQLENLNLSWNDELEELPKSFSKLSALRKLEISNCKRLPKSFGNLPALRILSLCSNQLKELPETFGNFFQLEKCHINCSRLAFPSYKVLASTAKIFRSNDCLLECKEKIVKQHQQEANYEAHSFLGKLYQGTIKQAPIEELKYFLGMISPEDRHMVFRFVLKYSCSDDLEIAIDHVFDDIHIFYRAVRETVLKKLKTLPKESRNEVYERVFMHAHQVGDPEWEKHDSESRCLWGKLHALDNLARLADAFVMCDELSSLNLPEATVVPLPESMVTSVIDTRNEKYEIPLAFAINEYHDRLIAFKEHISIGVLQPVDIETALQFAFEVYKYADSIKKLDKALSESRQAIAALSQRTQEVLEDILTAAVKKQKELSIQLEQLNNLERSFNSNPRRATKAYTSLLSDTKELLRGVLSTAIAENVPLTVLRFSFTEWGQGTQEQKLGALRRTIAILSAQLGEVVKEREEMKFSLERLAKLKLSLALYTQETKRRRFFL
jgi:Leucine-rich repeat (LRR) protein